MIEKGADTFWEAFMPGDDKLSPYGDFRINSYCHAWSCGPSYFRTPSGSLIFFPLAFLCRL